MNNTITRTKTSFPIGKSGFYLTSKRLGGMYIESIKKVAKSLYAVRLTGMGNYRVDELGTSASTVWDMTIFDTDEKSFTSGYVKKISDKLYAIFDISSHEVGWPAEDVVVIKNIQTGKRTTIRYKAPANDGLVLKRKNFFIFSGEKSLFKGDTSMPSDCSKIKRWAAFVDKEGRLVHSGSCRLSEAEMYDEAVFKTIA